MLKFYFSLLLDDGKGTYRPSRTYVGTSCVVEKVRRRTLCQRLMREIEKKTKSTNAHKMDTISYNINSAVLK